MRIKALAYLLLVAVMLPGPPSLRAQEQAAGTPDPLASAESFDTSYVPSAAVTYRMKRNFLDGVFRSAGADARAAFQEEFDAKSHELIWESLVVRYGLRTGNVADAMAAYWMLNWIVANGAFDVDIDAGPVRRQLTMALANDASFATLRNDQRQEMAERLMLDFLVLHAALTTAVKNQDVPTLQALAAAAVLSFRQEYRVELLALVPGPDGLVPKSAPESGESEPKPAPEGEAPAPDDPGEAPGSGP